MKKFKYNLDSEGNVVACGYLSTFEYEVKEDDPFTGFDISDYRKDLITNQWIYDPFIMVPTSITKLQAVSRLLEIDKYNDLMTALDADVTGVDRILFDAAHQLDRDSAMVAKMAVALGFDEAGTDEFFIEASKILV